MIKLSDFLMQQVAGLGVKDVFMLSGGGCMHLVDSLGKTPGLNYVCNLHEQACAIAADAYSQYTNNIGVALVTTGPGATNTITGVCASWIDSIAVLIISGQVKRADLMEGTHLRQSGPQEVDTISIVKPVTKYAVRVTDPATIKFHFEKAVHLARTGRPGPVWLDIPLDVQAAMIEEEALEGFVSMAQGAPSGLDEKAAAAARLLQDSRRPVILAGNGIRLARAVPEFLQLIERLQVPVLTTWKAIDFLAEDHPLYFGRPGAIGQRAANFIQQNSDLIITIGARLDKCQVAFDYKNFARGARKVIVDIDAAEIGKMGAPAGLPVAADAKDFIRALGKVLEGPGGLSIAPWMGQCRAWRAKYPVIVPEYKNSKNGVNTYVLVDELSKALTEDDVLVPGSSASCSEVTLQAFKVKAGQRIFNSPGLGSMGFGLAASIGACMASGKKRTVCLIGDGGLQHNIQELELLKRHNLPVKLFVLDNNGYASIRASQTSHFKGHLVGCSPCSGVTLPDTIAVAQAYGLKTRRIENHGQLAAGIRKALDGNGPVVCEVVIDEATVTAPRVVSEVKADGSIVSKPMEDLWPFLDRQEFQANMTV